MRRHAKKEKEKTVNNTRLLQASIDVPVLSATAITKKKEDIRTRGTSSEVVLSQSHTTKVDSQNERRENNDAQASTAKQTGH